MNELVTDDLIVHEKFLIRASCSDFENVLAIPLIHFIHDHFEKCEIDIILNEGQFNPFALMPFSTRPFYLPKEKSSLPGVHHYAYNLKEVFNVDYYIDLCGGLKEAFMGFSFKAKRRIGFAQGLQKFFLTDRVEFKSRPKTDRDFMLFTPFLAPDDSASGQLFKVKAAESATVAVTGSGAFLLVVIDTLYAKDAKNQLWIDFFDCLVGERIALYIHHVELAPQEKAVDNDVEDKTPEELSRERKKQFTNALDPRNRYIHIPHLDHTTLKTLACASTAVVCDTPCISILAAYMQKKSFCFVPNEKSVGLEHYYNVPQWIYVDGGVPSRLIGETQSYSLSDMSVLIDYIFDDSPSDSEDLESKGFPSED